MGIFFFLYLLVALPPLLTLTALVTTLALARAVRRGRHESTPTVIASVAFAAACVATTITFGRIAAYWVNLGVALVVLVAAIAIAVVRRR